jgi:hypothetical protein
VLSCQYLGYKQFNRHCDICKGLRLKIPTIHSRTHKLRRYKIRWMYLHLREDRFCKDYKQHSAIFYVDKLPQCITFIRINVAKRILWTISIIRKQGNQGVKTKYPTIRIGKAVLNDPPLNTSSTGKAAYCFSQLCKDYVIPMADFESFQNKR